MTRSNIENRERREGLWRAGRIESLDLTGGIRARVACGHGRLWITRENDPVDHFLRSGETGVFAGPGRIVLEALEESAVSLEACPAA